MLDGLRGSFYKSVLLVRFLCGTPPSCLNVMGGCGGGGGLQDFSVSPGSGSLSLSLSKSLSEPE